MDEIKLKRTGQGGREGRMQKEKAGASEENKGIDKKEVNLKTYLF